jgi:hypothetical protein
VDFPDRVTITFLISWLYKQLFCTILKIYCTSQVKEQKSCLYNQEINNVIVTLSGKSTPIENQGIYLALFISLVYKDIKNT